MKDESLNASKGCLSSGEHMISISQAPEEEREVSEESI